MTTVCSAPSVVLRKYLQKIRTTYYALQFCNLLIEAQKMLEESGNKENMCSEHYEPFLRDLEGILKKESADELGKRILLSKVQTVEGELNQQRLGSLLKSVRTIEPTKYFNQLIEIVERYVDSISPRLHFNLRRERRLATLKEYMLWHGNEEANNIILAIFWIGSDERGFAIEEKEAIIEAMPWCETLITKCCLDIPSRIDAMHALRKRSALQYLKDLLADDSAEDNTLKELVVNLDDTMERLDSMAEWSVTLFKYPVEEDYYNDTLEDFYDFGANVVPKEHTWWQQYKIANFS